MIEDLDITDQKSNPKYYQYQAYIAGAMVYMGQLDQAKEILDEIESYILTSGNSELMASFYYFSGFYQLYNGQDFPLSVTYFSKTLKIEEENELNLFRRARSADRMGLIFAQFLEKYDSAIYYFKKSLKDYIEINGEVHFAVAGRYAMMAQTYYAQGDIEQSLVMNKASLSIVAREINPQVFDGVQFSKGYDSLTNFFQTYMSLIQEKDVLPKIHPSNLSTMINTAFALTELGHLDLAEIYFRKTELIHREKENWGRAAGANNGLANIYLKRSQFKYALDLYRTSLSYYMRTNTEDPFNQREIAWVYNNIGALYEAQEMPDSSMYYNKKALEIRKSIMSPNNWQLGLSYLNLGSDYLTQKNYKKSLEFLNKVSMDQFPYAPSLANAKGNAFNGLKQADSALHYYKKAIRVIDDVRDVNYSLYHSQLADFFDAQDQPDSALYYYHQTLSVNIDGTAPESLFETDVQSIIHPVSFLETLLTIVRFSNKQFEKTQDSSHLTRARRAITLSKKVITSIRSSFIQEVDNVAFYKLTREMIDVSLESFALDNANESSEDLFQMIDLGKSHIVLSAVKSRKLGASSSQEELLSKLSKLKNRITKERSKLLTISIKDKAFGSTSPSSSTLKELEQQLAESLIELRKSQPGLHGYLTSIGGSFSKRELDSYLRSTNSSILQFFWSSDRLTVVTLSDGNFTVHQPELNPDSLHANLASFKAITKDPTKVNPISYKEFVNSANYLYNSVLAPLLLEVSSEKLLIIPDGPFQNLPFEILLSAEVNSDNVNFGDLPYLIKSFEINYASSVALLLANNSAAHQNNTEYMAWAPFSATTGASIDSEILRDESLSGLPGTTKELEALASVFKGVQFFSENADEYSFKSNANEASIIHIATHGIINDQQPELSNLVFGETIESDTVDDNRLFMFELYAMALNSELAVLTACNTGAGKQEQGEGTISLARAFKYAGAKSVLMSLWLANDQSTSDIVGNFYRNLADKQGKGEALRNAKLQYLKQADNLGSHPFYWSHLILSGDSSPLSSSGFPTLWLLIGFGLLVVAFLGFRKHKKPVN
ncbi:MAG: hypothetical protein Roseis2KO_32350 [Roseivirga sp.]